MHPTQWQGNDYGIVKQYGLKNFTINSLLLDEIDRIFFENCDQYKTNDVDGHEHDDVVKYHVKIST